MIQIKENVLQADMKSGLNSTAKILNFSTFNFKGEAKKLISIDIS